MIMNLAEKKKQASKEYGRLKSLWEDGSEEIIQTQPKDTLCTYNKSDGSMTFGSILY